jgi:tetratricopeptide (TPR) repeat protein
VLFRGVHHLYWRNGETGWEVNMKRVCVVVVAIIMMFSISSCFYPNKILEDAVNNKKTAESLKKEYIVITGLIEKEEYDEAFEKISEIMITKQINPIEMNEIAYKLIDNGRTEEAVFILNNLIENKYNFSAIFNNLSWAYSLMGKYKLSSYYADKSLAILPNEDVEYVNKGNALRGLDKSDEAIKYYDMAIKQNEKCTYAYWGKAICTYENKDYKNSIQLFKKYAQLKPDDERSTRYYITSCYNELKQYDEAQKELEKHFAADPSDTSPLYSIANIYYTHKHDYVEAMKYYEKIISIDRNDAWAYLDVARCLASLNKKDEACEYIKKAIELDEECLYDLSYYDEFDKLKKYKGFLEIFKPRAETT